MSSPVASLRREAGTTSLLALFLALVVAGLSLGLVTESGAARASVTRQETSFRALEIAEAGVCHAEVELRGERDPDGDGVGTVKGSFASGTFEATAGNDPINRDRFIITAKGTHGLSVRRIEVGIRKRAKSYFVEGLFSRNDLTLNGTIQTDAYDSRLGTYASQATNVDAGGTYALAQGDIGSNGGITLNGSSPYIRGNSIPGPEETVTNDAIPPATILGDVYPREIEVPLPPIPLSTFQAAMTTNNNGAWIVAGGSILWNASRYSMRVNAGTTLTLAGGTYFFSDFVLRAGATLNVIAPCKIYTTGSFDLSGGSLMNATTVPGNFQVYSHPYPLPTAFPPIKTEVKLSGGALCAAAIYAPEVDVTISGNADFFGAIVSRQVVIQGNPYFHYDLALGQIEIAGGSTLERIYWRELSPPPR